MTPTETIKQMANEIGYKRLVQYVIKMWSDDTKNQSEVLVLGPPASQVVPCFCASEFFRGDPLQCDCCGRTKWMVPAMKNMVTQIERKIQESEVEAALAAKENVQ